jgi:uncharacterized membrane protein
LLLSDSRVIKSVGREEFDMSDDWPRSHERANMQDVIEDLEDLERMVDDDDEREHVREARRAAEEAREPGVLGRFRRGFGLRDAGEAVIGGFVFGVPMIVEDGTYEVGRYIANDPPSLLITILFGGSLILGILHAGGFEQVKEDRLFGLVPLRLVGILGISVGLAVGLLTIWGQIDWSDPVVAGSQTAVVAIAMGVGGSVGDILPE